MQEYMAKSEEMSAQIASIQGRIDEGPLVMMFVERLRNRSNSPFGTDLLAQMTRVSNIWQMVSSRLLQEFESQQAAM